MLDAKRSVGFSGEKDFIRKNFYGNKFSRLCIVLVWLFTI